MVTVQEARSQIAIQRAAVQSQRQTIQQRTEQPKLTAQQVRQQTRGSLAQRQLQSTQLGSIRKKALATLIPIEKELTKAEVEVKSVESQIAAQQQRLSDFEQAKKIFRGVGFDPGASPQIKKFIREFQAGREITVEKAVTEGLAEIERRGLEPIFINGELRGVSDFLTQQSRTLEQLEPIVINGQLVGFQDIAQQLSRQLREPIAVDVALPKLPPGVVQAAESRTDQLTRLIKESTPQFEFIKNEAIRDLVKIITPEKRVGVILGTEKFLKSELEKTLTDPTGAFKFRPDQAKPLTNLIFEVGENFALGLGVGKGITLVRGAVARILPKALKGSAKFNKVLNTAGVLGVITLTTAQGLSIKKTFETEGEDAAILQTIGFISFGAGFGVTGLKSLPQAEKEFKQITDLLKKAIPPGKRGETRFDELGRFLKKKKKGAFGELETLNQDEVQRGREVLAAIERRLAKAKTPKEQAKILAEIKKGLNTPQAKQNFENFVLGLIEKDVIKFPKVEIVPGVKVKGLPGVKGIKAFVPKVKTPGRLRELARVKQNQARNQRRITQSNISLGKRFAKAQLLISGTKLVSGQTTAQKIKQRQKQIQKQIQKTKQVQRTQQRLKQRQLQRTRQVSKLALKQLFKQSFKIPRPRIKIRRLRLPPPFILPFPKKKIVKKKIKIIPFNIKGESFDVFERRRGKSRKIASSLPPNLAKRTLSRALDRKLSASGRIIASKNPPKKKDIKSFDFPSRKFRRPVPNSPLRQKGAFVIVERSRFRLDSKKEIKSIQRARKLKKIPMSLRVR